MKKFICCLLLLAASLCCAQQTPQNQAGANNNWVIVGNPAQSFSPTQKGTIQDAINFAGSGGVVWIPPNYAGTEPLSSLTNPNNVLVVDLRGGSFKTLPALSGSASPPGVAVAPATLNFGDVQTGSDSLPRLITISNTGSSSSITINSTILSGSTDFQPPTIHDCDGALPGGGSCSFSVFVHPSSTGAKAGLLSVNTSISPTFSVALAANGTPAPTAPLTVTATDTGSGTITSADGRINCVIAPPAFPSGACGPINYLIGTPITLRATAASGSTLVSVNGSSCAVSPCNLVMSNPGATIVVDFAENAPVNVASVVVAPPAINFNSVQIGSTSIQNITISNTGTTLPLTVNSTVLSGNADFSCANPSICSTPVILLPGAAFVVPLQFKPTAAAPETATATVNTNAPLNPLSPPVVNLSGTGTGAATFLLSVAGAGTGSGIVQSGETPPLINCTFAPPANPAGTCANNYVSGSVVHITAAPTNGGSLASLTGGLCNGSPCDVTVSAATTLTATFNPPTPNFNLTITAQGQGGGTIVSDVGGAQGILNCSASAGVVSSGGNSGCSGSFPQGTVVTLTETPNGSSTFAGWTGPCTGTATTCAVTVNSNVTATVNFTPSTVPLTLIQTATNCSVVTTTIACNWAQAQSAGDFIVLSGGWPDATTTVSSLSDTKGNTYTQVPTISPKLGTSLTEVAYYAQNIVAATAGANTTTLTLSSSAAAAVSGSNLTSGGSAVAGTTFTTASVTPTTGRLVTIAVASHLGSGNGPGAIASITGNGLTWVNVTSLDYGLTTGTGKTNRIEVWRAMGTASAGAITITFTASPTVASWTVSQFSGTDSTGSNGSGAIGIIATNPANSATASPLTVTMGAFGSSSNGTYGVGATDATETINNGTSMTALGGTASTFSQSIADEWAVGNVSPVTETYTGGSVRWGMIGIEIKAGSTGRRDIRAAEYSGVKTTGSPVDVSAAAIGTSATPAAGSITTTQANDLLVGLLLSSQSVNSADTAHNWVQRVKNTFGDDLEDQEGVATSTAANFQPSLTASGNWVAMNIAFLNNGGGVSTNFSLTLTGAGGGAGVVTGNAGNPTMNCTISGGVVSGACSSSVSLGSSVTLTATPNAGSAFAGWTGVNGCGSSPQCIVPNITANGSIVANFTLSGVQNYYVNVGTGSDSNDGLAATTGGGHGPWKSITKSIASFVLGAGGTTINVAAGTYSDTTGSACFTSVFCDNRSGGGLTQRLVFQCSTPLACFITTTVWLQNVNYVDVVGFDVGNLPNNNNAIASISTSAATGNSLHLLANYFHDVGQNVAFNGISGCTNDGMIVLGPAHGASYSNTDLQVIGNLLYHYGTVGNGCNNGHGIYLGSANGKIQNNIVSNITTTGIEIYDQPCNTTISNNTIYRSGRGIQLAGGSCSSGKNTILNNVIDSIIGNGIDLGSGTGTSCVIGGLTLMSHNMLNGDGTNFLIGAASSSNPTTNTSCENYSGNIITEAPTTTFVNYVAASNGVTAGDVHLKAGSAAISGGSTTGVTGGTAPFTPTTDFAGSTRVNSDIGAYKFP